MDVIALIRYHKIMLQLQCGFVYLKYFFFLCAAGDFLTDSVFVFQFGKLRGTS